MNYPTFTDAAKASGKRLDASQKASLRVADADPTCCAVDLFLRKGRLVLRRVEGGVTWQVIA